MTTALAAGFNPPDATSAIAATGVIGIFCVLVAETGVLVGFFRPGDALSSSDHRLSIIAVAVVISLILVAPELRMRRDLSGERPPARRSVAGNDQR